MFDDVPVRVWLLIGIAAVGYLPAHYVVRHIAHSPSRRDITQPVGDLDWRSSGQLVRSSILLAALAGLALFIFTPAAERIARSPLFWPILSALVGAWMVSTVPRGLFTGQIEPITKGSLGPYKRETQPKRFWASLGWNALFGCGLIWAAFASNQEASAQGGWDRCYDKEDAYPPRDRISACNKLLSDPDNVEHVASLVGARGYAHYRNGDDLLAVLDYEAAIALSPDDNQAYVDRGNYFLDRGSFDRAIADFTRAHELNPKDLWALANRGIAYAWKKEQALAEKDFEAVRALDPSNPVMLRGEALLSMHAGDMKEAVRHLTASMERTPDSTFALAARAEAYRQLGEHDKARADMNRLTELKEEAVRSTGG